MPHIKSIDSFEQCQTSEKEKGKEKTVPFSHNNLFCSSHLFSPLLRSKNKRANENKRISRGRQKNDSIVLSSRRSHFCETIIFANKIKYHFYFRGTNIISIIVIIIVVSVVNVLVVFVVVIIMLTITSQHDTITNGIRMEYLSAIHRVVRW